MPIRAGQCRGAGGVGVDEAALLNSIGAFYGLNETSGSGRIDGSGNGYTLADVGTVPRVTGKVGYGASFNGANQVLWRASALGLRATSSYFTITAWVNISTNNGVNTIVAKRGDAPIEYEVFYDGIDEKLRLRCSADGFALKFVETTMALDSWQFIVAEIDLANTTLRLRVNDGAPVTAEGPASIWDGGQVFALGAAFTGVTGSNFCQGVLDAIGIWKRRLTPLEIAHLYNAGLGNEVFTG